MKIKIIKAENGYILQGDCLAGLKLMKKLSDNYVKWYFHSIGDILEVDDCGSNYYDVKNKNCYYIIKNCEIVQEREDNNINKMKEVAIQTLGLKWHKTDDESEPFNIILKNDTLCELYKSETPFRITREGLKSTINSYKNYHDTLTNILTGDYTIQKIPKKINGLDAWKVYNSHNTIKSCVSGHIYGANGNGYDLYDATDEEIEGEWEIVD